MPLVSQSINALYGGVSQQAAVQRGPTQLESALNCSFGLAEGASKRPPLETITQLTATALADPAIGWIPVSTSETFIVVVPGDGSYAVYRESDGAKLTTENVDTGLAYLTCTGKASEAFRFTFVDDKLYVVNREFTAAMTAAEAPGTLAGTVQTLQDPDLNNATSGIYKILGAEENPFDTYYVKHVGGYWVEWIAPGVQYQIDGATMPHTFDMIADGVDPLGFVAQFNPVAWTDRRVGDNDSNKAPSFVGHKINAVGVAADRLTLMSERATTMSRVDDHVDFWRSSVTAVLDDDRIDIEVTATETTDLAWMKPVSGQFVMFSADQQYALDGTPALTPSTVSAKTITKYPVSIQVEPVVIGANVFFASDGGAYTRLREMYMQEDTITLDAADASAHVFKYVPKLRDMAGHPSYDHIVMAPVDETSALYSYQYMWSGNQKNLSAWGKWKLSTNIDVLSMRVIDQYVYMVYQLKEGTGDTYLGRVNLEPGYKVAGFSHAVHMDHLQKLNGSFNATEDRTYFVSHFPVTLQTTVNPRTTSTQSPSISTIGGLGWLGASSSEYYVRYYPETEIPAGLSVGDTLEVHRNNGEVWTTVVDIIDLTNQRVTVETTFPPDPPIPSWALSLSEVSHIAYPSITDGATIVTVTDSVGARVVRGQGFSAKGTSLDLTNIVGYQQGLDDFSFSLPGDWSTGDLWFGYPYEQRVRLSEQFFTENGNPVLNARTQIRNMQVHFTETGVFRTEVKSRGRDVYIQTIYPGTKHQYTSRTLGDEYFTLNSPQLDNGVYDFPVLGKASDVTIEFVNDSYLPANFQSAEWRGLVSKRMTR